MNKRIDTIDLKGNKYAQVSTRIKEFRESNPNGRISTTYEIVEGQFIFTAEIYKNKDDSSPDAVHLLLLVIWLVVKLQALKKWKNFNLIKEIESKKLLSS